MLTLLGIVVPAAFIAIAVHRWIEHIDWKIVLLCLALAVAFVGRGMFSDAVPVPLDDAIRGWPYRGVVGDVHVKNPLTNDTTKQIRGRGRVPGCLVARLAWCGRGRHPSFGLAGEAE